MELGFLHRYFLNNTQKPIYKWSHYFDIYERHFSRFCGKSPVILEIGVMGGGSLQMWKSYFGDGAKIIGLDINADCKAHEEDGIEIFIGSQDDPDVIDQIFSKYPKIDIVLDDGSHIMQHMIRSFELIYGRVHHDGVYMVEDMHTCYWPEYGGGLYKEDGFMEYAKDSIDNLNAVHTRGGIQLSQFTKSTASVTFYDSVVVFERKPQGKRLSFRTQGM